MSGYYWSVARSVSINVDVFIISGKWGHSAHSGQEKCWENSHQHKEITRSLLKFWNYVCLHNYINISYIVWFMTIMIILACRMQCKAVYAQDKMKTNILYMDYNHLNSIKSNCLYMYIAKTYIDSVMKIMWIISIMKKVLLCIKAVTLWMFQTVSVFLKTS